MNTVILNILNFLGVSVNEINSPIVNLCVANFIFSIVSLLCVLNIIIYLVILYVNDRVEIMSLISKYRFIVKLFDLYKKTGIIYLVFEFIFLLIAIGYTINLNYSVLSVS